MNNFSDFDLDLQNVKADSSNVEPQFYSKWFCTTQGYIECIVTIITTLVTELSCQDYSCGCPGAGATDVEFGCPPKDTGTLDVCVNNINNTY